MVPRHGFHDLALDLGSEADSKPGQLLGLESSLHLVPRDSGRWIPLMLFEPAIKNADLGLSERQFLRSGLKRFPDVLSKPNPLFDT
jgi:hypothetical protein